MLTDDVTAEEKTQKLGRRQDDYPKLVISRDQGEFNWNSMGISVLLVAKRFCPHFMFFRR